MRFLEGVPLAPRTTLGVGGAARRLVDVESERDVEEALAEARARGERVLVLGGGSNLVVSDAGFDGLVVNVASRGVRVTSAPGGGVQWDVAAGEEWDAIVARAVGEGLRGVECLSGIPGRVGATPIQNVGAYGQEVSDTIARVRVVDRLRGEAVDLAPSACGFGYRRSAFKGSSRWVVVGVTFVLVPSHESAPIRYAELARALGVRENEAAPLEDVRRTVLALRRSKGMVVDPSDPDSVSAGSFFVNPLLEPAELVALERRVAARLGEGVRAPCFAAADGRQKVSAAWLIERAGFAKGHRAGNVGISTKHALALVNRGGGTARELLAFAAEIQRGVRDIFGVELETEPVIVAG